MVLATMISSGVTSAAEPTPIVITQDNAVASSTDLLDRFKLSIGLISLDCSLQV
jgi:hypothetical protein